MSVPVSKGLGDTVTAVLLMTYDWGKSLGPFTSVAPVNKMRELFDYSVTKIPPAKTYIGIPTFGYDWALSPNNDVTNVNFISNETGINLAVEMEAVIQYDEISQAPFYYYTQDSGTDIIRHIVWFEDARSIDAKVKLVPEYGFRGISILNVMNYFPQLWLVINAQYDIRKAI